MAEIPDKELKILLLKVTDDFKEEIHKHKNKTGGGNQDIAKQKQKTWWQTQGDQNSRNKTPETLEMKKPMNESNKNRRKHHKQCRSSKIM